MSSADAPASSWQGIAGYFKYQATPMIAIVPRVEYFNDANGFQTGIVQKLTDFTLTRRSSSRWTTSSSGSSIAGTTRDVSGSAVPPPFVNDTGSGKSSQNSFIFGVLYSFTTK